MGHVYRHTLCLDQKYTYTKGDILCFRLWDGSCDHVKRNPPPSRGGKTSSRQDKSTKTFRPRETRKDRGREEEKLPFSCPPTPRPTFTLSEQNPRGNKQPPVPEGIGEKCLYQVLILWFFLRFLNFKMGNGVLILIWRDLLLLFIMTFIVLTVIITSCLLPSDTEVSLSCNRVFSNCDGHNCWLYKEMCWYTYIYIGIFELKDEYYLVHRTLNIVSLCPEALQLPMKHISETNCFIHGLKRFPLCLKWFVTLYHADTQRVAAGKRKQCIHLFKQW